MEIYLMFMGYRDTGLGVVRNTYELALILSHYFLVVLCLKPIAS